jgi:hypothetical protein
MLLPAKLQGRINQHKFIAEHPQMPVSEDSEFLPCLSDIIMNIRAPITNAKARRKDCERKTAEVSLQCDSSIPKMQLQAIANCTHRITLQKSCFAWHCHVSTNRCHVMSLKKIHGILCKVINKYWGTAYIAHKSDTSTKGKLELRRKRVEPRMKSVRLDGDISNRFYRGRINHNWHVVLLH